MLYFAGRLTELAFLPGTAKAPGRFRIRRLAAPDSSDKPVSRDDLFEWQATAERVSSIQSTAVGYTDFLDEVSSLPDVPDFSVEEDDLERPVQSQPIEDEFDPASSISATVTTREISSSELAQLAAEDVLPPEPAAGFGSLGLMEWVGYWLVSLGAGGIALYFVTQLFTRAQLDTDTADMAAKIVKPFLTACSVAFISRVLLATFARVREDEFPWSIVYYPTEWILAPTRKIIKPESGVDISPIFWCIVAGGLSELLTGPFGILTLSSRRI